MTTLDDVLNELQGSKVPPEVAKAWWDSTSKSNPEIQKSDAKRLAQGIVLAFETAKRGSFQLPKNDVQQVEVTGQRMPQEGIRPQDVSPNIPRSYQAPTEPLDPYKGSGSTPGEILKKQFALADYGSNTTNQAAREEEYKSQLRANNMGRGVTDIISSVSLLNSGKALQSNKEDWDRRDAQAKDTTVGRISREQDFMKNGIAAYRQGVETAGEVLNQMEKSGKFQIDANKAALEQKKLQLELVGTSANTQVTQQLIDPKSDISIAMRNSAKAQLKLSGLFNDKQIAEMVPDTMPGIEAAPIAKLGGESLENLIKKGQANQANAAAGLSSAQAGKVREETKGVVTGNAMLDDFRKGAGPTGFVPTISAGPVTLTNPGAQAESLAAGQNRVNTADRLQTYVTVGKPLINDVREMLNSGTYSGKGTAAIAAYVPQNEQAILLTKLAQVNNLYPNLVPEQLGRDIAASQKSGGFSGALLGSMTPTQLNNLLNSIENAVKAQVTIRKEQDEFEKKGGRPTEFYKEPGMNERLKGPATVPMTKNGEVFDIPADKVEAAKAKGYRLQ